MNKFLFLSDGKKTFKVLQLIIAVVCLFIPILLKLGDGSATFRESISNYVYMQKSYIFGMLLCMAAMLFIFNATVFAKNETQLSLNRYGKWYNIILGISLLGVILFPHLQYPITHYSFAGFFFIGNALVIGLFHKKENKVISIILANLVIITIALHFLFGFISLLVGEWLSLSTIGVHFILQSAGVVSIDMLKEPNFNNIAS